jgi:hypothetical protein
VYVRAYYLWVFLDENMAWCITLKQKEYMSLLISSWKYGGCSMIDAALELHEHISSISVPAHTLN